VVDELDATVESIYQRKKQALRDGLETTDSISAGQDLITQLRE